MPSSRAERSVARGETSADAAAGRCRSAGLSSRQPARAARSRISAATLSGEPRFAELAALVFRSGTPYAGLLVGCKGEFEARVPNLARKAHGLCGFDLLDCLTCGSDWKEQVRVGIAAGRYLTPIIAVPLTRAGPGQSHPASSAACDSRSTLVVATRIREQNHKSANPKPNRYCGQEAGEAAVNSRTASNPR